MANDDIMNTTMIIVLKSEIGLKQHGIQTIAAPKLMMTGVVNKGGEIPTRMIQRCPMAEHQAEGRLGCHSRDPHRPILEARLQTGRGKPNPAAVVVHLPS